GYVASAQLVLTVSLPTLAVVVPTLPPARVGDSYQVTLTTTGAVGTVTWSIASGSLPSGLSLNGSTGTIAGTPSAAGSFTATERLPRTTCGCAARQRATPTTTTRSTCSSPARSTRPARQSTGSARRLPRPSASRTVRMQACPGGAGRTIRTAAWPARCTSR